MFYIFSGQDHYPSGGIRDFRASCKSLDDAKDYIIANLRNHDWFEIVKFQVINDNIEHETVYLYMNGKQLFPSKDFK